MTPPPGRTVGGRRSRRPREHPISTRSTGDRRCTGTSAISRTSPSTTSSP